MKKYINLDNITMGFWFLGALLYFINFAMHGQVMHFTLACVFSVNGFAKLTRIKKKNK